MKGKKMVSYSIKSMMIFVVMLIFMNTSTADMTPENKEALENKEAIDSMSLLNGPIDDDYYMYSEYYPDYTSGYLGACGCYVDASNDEFIYFWDSTGTAYKVKIETEGDPQQHPDHCDPEHVGPVTARTFTFITSHNCIGDMGVSFYVCDADEFHVNEEGIYLGPGTNGIWKWAHDWSSPTQIGPKLNSAQSLAYNPDTKTWYSGKANREIYALSDTNDDGSYMDESWTPIFTHPDYAGSHHDGMW